MLNFASTIPQTKNTTTYGYIRLKMQQLRYSTIRDNCQRAADEISFPFVALDTGSRHCTHTLKRQNSTRSFSFQSINLKKKNAQPPPPLFDTEKLYTFCTKWREGIESAVHYVSEKRMHNHRHLTLTLKKWSNFCKKWMEWIESAVHWMFAFVRTRVFGVVCHDMKQDKFKRNTQRLQAYFDKLVRTKAWQL